MRGQTILITGGTGSLGSNLIQQCIRRQPQKIICFSRDEFKQVELKRTLNDKKHLVRFFIGDIRDRERLYRAFVGVDCVIHCAALKNIAATEYNPSETVKTNTVGAMNIIDAAIDRGVGKVLAISTDKAVNPISLYGAAKLCADKLFIAANNYGETKFSVIRFGNFEGSRGSVIPLFTELAKQNAKTIPITDFRMTRFWISIEDAAKRTLQALGLMNGGEIFAPKMKIESIRSLASRLCPNTKQKEIGIRDGEKLYEELVLIGEAKRTISTKDFYITYPKEPQWGDRVPHDFCYNSKL